MLLLLFGVVAHGPVVCEPYLWTKGPRSEWVLGLCWKRYFFSISFIPHLLLFRFHLSYGKWNTLPVPFLQMWQREIYLPHQISAHVSGSKKPFCNLKATWFCPSLWVKYLTINIFLTLFHRFCHWVFFT